MADVAPLKDSLNFFGTMEEVMFECLMKCCDKEVGKRHIVLNKPLRSRSSCK